MHMVIVIRYAAGIAVPERHQPGMGCNHHLLEQVLLDPKRRRCVCHDVQDLGGQIGATHFNVLLIGVSQTEDIAVYAAVQVQIVLAVVPIYVFAIGPDTFDFVRINFRDRVGERRRKNLMKGRGYDVGHDMADSLLAVECIILPAPDFIPLEHEIQAFKY